jgi:putative heme iron utilization protein
MPFSKQNLGKKIKKKNNPNITLIKHGFKGNNCMLIILPI